MIRKYFYRFLQHLNDLCHLKIYKELKRACDINPFCGSSANSAKPDQTPPNLHCLLVECSIKNLNKNYKKKKQTNKKQKKQHPFKRKWTVPIDNRGKFH